MEVMRRCSKKGAAVTGRAPQQDLDNATVTTTNVISSEPAAWHDQGNQRCHACFKLQHVKHDSLCSWILYDIYIPSYMLIDSIERSWGQKLTEQPRDEAMFQILC